MRVAAADDGAGSSNTESVAAVNVFMGENDSGRYESRFTTVRIDESPAIMLQGMAKSTLGIWVAHGEGRCCQFYTCIRNFYFYSGDM